MKNNGDYNTALTAKEDADVEIESQTVALNLATVKVQLLEQKVEMIKGILNDELEKKQSS